MELKLYGGEDGVYVADVIYVSNVTYVADVIYVIYVAYVSNVTYVADVMDLRCWGDGEISLKGVRGGRK